MTPLEAARRLAKQHPAGSLTNTKCHLCGGRALCYEDCPWFTMPRIVAALEAAEKTLWSLDHFPLTETDVRTGYARHVLDGMKQALVAALKGEATP